MGSAFQPILADAVDRTPGAIGSAFSAFDGELVDAHGTPAYEWDIFSAHYGVVLQGINAALATLHFGETQHVIIEHNKIDVLVVAVSHEYYMVLATTSPMAIAQALAVAATTSRRLREEMGF